MQLSNSLNRIENLRRGWGSGVIAFLIILGLHFGGALAWLERGASDVLRRQLASPIVSPIEIVYLDESSLSEAEKDFGITWPWPREPYGKAVRFLKYAGAKAVIFDFLFTSVSKEGLGDDKAFADAIKSHGQVYAGMQLLGRDDADSIARLEKLGAAYALPLKTDAKLQKGTGVDLPYAPLLGAFKGLGCTDFIQDNDGQGRRSNVVAEIHGKLYPSLTLAAAWNLSGRPALKLEDGLFTMGDKKFSVDARGNINLLFRQYDRKKPHARLLDLIQSQLMLDDHVAPKLDPSQFKDKIVFIGSNSAGQVDLRPSPMSKSMPGVELQAMALDNLLSGQSLRVINMDIWMWLLLLAGCLLIARFSFSFPGLAVLLPTLLVSVGFATLAVYDYQSHAILLPMANPILGAVLTLALTAGEHYRLERKQRSRVQNIFGQFLSPAVLQKLNSGENELKTGGETKDLAVFFSDLAGFTSFSEKLGPQQLVVILNEYLEEMAEVVVGRHDGYVDKYIGDAIMAIWGAPTPHENPALAAARAAWHCQIRLAEIQAKLASMGLDAGDEGLVMRVGIHYGPCVVGLMGSRRKLNYTVMGDTVNTASRLEGANKPYGTRVMLSDTAKEACGDKIKTRVLDFLTVKGKTEPTKVHHLIGLSDEGGALYDDAYVARYHSALELYRQAKFADAMAALKKLKTEQPKDSVLNVYIDRCDHYIAEPPAAGWDGVYVMKTK